MKTRKLNAALFAGLLATLGGTEYATAQSEPHFIDATARLFHSENIHIDPLVFVGPFAVL